MALKMNTKISKSILSNKGLNQSISKSFNALVIDNHPLTCRAYTSLLNKASEIGIIPSVKDKVMHTCKEVFENVLNGSSNNLDLIILEIKLPGFAQEKIFNGEDLGKLLRKKWGSTKLIIVTSIVDPYRLQKVLKSLNPDALLLKNELCEKTLMYGLQKVLQGIPEYSPTVLKIIKDQFISEEKISFQEKEFLYLLSTGIPSKEIPQHLPWSLSKVEKQKRILKEKLGVEEKSSWGLIHKAKELAII